MIAKSDLIILLASTLALAAGVYRWQQNVAAPTLAAAPTSTRVTDPVSPAPAEDAVAGRLSPSEETTGADEPSGSTGSVIVRRVSPEGSDPAAPAPSTSTDVPAPEGSNGGDTVLRTEGSAAGRVDMPLPSPENESGADDGALAANTEERALYGTHRVSSGDYLGKLAERYNTSIGVLQSINDLDGTVIRVGDELRYPLPAN